MTLRFVPKRVEAEVSRVRKMLAAFMKFASSHSFFVILQALYPVVLFLDLGIEQTISSPVLGVGGSWETLHSAIAVSVS